MAAEQVSAMSEDAGLLRKLDRTGVPLLACRLVLGYLFISMGASKAADPFEFLKLIREYQMVPEGATTALNLIAVVLPWLEILCGALLIAGVAIRGVSLLLLVMLIGFTGAVVLRALGIYQSESIAFCAIQFDCGCGSGPQYICKKLLENTGLALLAALALVSRSRRFCLRGQLMSTRDPRRADL
jgi:uncharacterized membrane protein YphA (DoxX/SURF4 family)